MTISAGFDPLVANPSGDLLPMNVLKKSVSSAVLAAAVVVSAIAPAHADRNGRIGAGIAVGVIAGAIIAGAAVNARASEGPVRVYSGPDCREFRRKARWAEENGQPRRAQYYWDRHAECRGE
jgi:hypothetical protein